MTTHRERRLARAATAKRILATLIERYPVFTATRSDTKVLAVGISAAIIADAPELNPTDIGIALQVYTSAPAYLIACSIPGTPRHDLQNNVVGEVSLSEADHAAERLATLRDLASCRADGAKAERNRIRKAQAARKAAEFAAALERRRLKRAERETAVSSPRPIEIAPPPDGRPRLGLAALKQAALRRREQRA